MRLPNVYLRFETAEERVLFLYPLLGIAADDFKSKRGMQDFITRMTYGTTSSPYYRAFKWKSGETKGNRKELWRPYLVHRRGIRRLYFRYTVQGRSSYWLAVQLESSETGKRLFLELLALVPTDQRVILGRIPHAIQAESLVRHAERVMAGIKDDPLPPRTSLFRVQSDLMQAKALDPAVYQGDRVYLWEQLAFHWCAHGKLKRMEHCFRQQAELQPGCADAFLNMGFFYAQEEQLAQAESCYLEGLHRDPEDAHILHNLADIYRKYPISKAELLEVVNRAILANPSLPSIYKLKADLHAEWEELEPAITLYRHARSLCTEAYTEFTLELDEAIRIMEREQCRRDSMRYYDGDLKNGLRHGHGREYHEHGGLKYEGAWRDDRKHGYGKGYWSDGTLWYEGEFQRDEPEGVGRMYFKSGALRYEGQFKARQYCGYGTEYYEDGQIKFVGKFAENSYFFHGTRNYVEGKLYYPSGQLWYEGKFTNCSKHAQFYLGVEYDEDGAILKHWEEQ